MDKDTCKSIKSINFKNGLNYFKDFTYTYKVYPNSVSVYYQDGRFTSMSKAIFDKHFKNI